MMSQATALHVTVRLTLKTLSPVGPKNRIKLIDGTL